MQVSLIPHPDTPGGAISGIHVSWERHIGLGGAAVLALDYRVYGALNRIKLPPPAAPGRGERLWEHTCFEAFVRESGDESYVEVNLSSSNEWAAYRFESYRAGMCDADTDLMHRAQVIDGVLQIGASIDLDLRGDASWQLSLAAIVEETNGRKSYWALAHPPGSPDFHHPDCFALELPAPEPA